MHKLSRQNDVIYLTVGTSVIFIIVLLLCIYIRTGGSYILFATSLGAIPTGFTIIIISYMLRNADKRIQLVWCSIIMILIRSVHLWRPGIDFGDEWNLIRETTYYFQKGILVGYLKSFPANIPFVAIFYAFYLISHDVETFELLVFFVYPLLIVGYYFMAKEITNLYRTSSKPAIPVIMFLPFVPIFSIITTFYWPQVMSLAVLFFSCAILLRLLSLESLNAKNWVMIMASSTILVFSHAISTALFLLTILFLYLSCGNGAKRWILLRVGVFTFLTFTLAHFNLVSYVINMIIYAIQRDAISLQVIDQLDFTSIESVFRNTPLMILAHTGLFIIVGSLILLRAYRLLNHDSIVTIRSKILFLEWLALLKSDTIVFSYLGFSVLSFVLAFYLYGGFLDPIRVMSWASLFALPVVIPSKKRDALLLMVILLALFFLLIWTVNSPWGYLYGSVNGLTTRARS